MKRFGKMVFAGVILSILAVNFCSAKDKEVQEDTTEDLTQEVCSDGRNMQQSKAQSRCRYLWSIFRITDSKKGTYF